MEVRDFYDGMLLCVDVAPGNPRLGAGKQSVRVVDCDMMYVHWPGVTGSLCKGAEGNWFLSWYEDDVARAYSQACSAPSIDPNEYDFATIGCLLAIAQNLWQDESLHTFQDDYGYGVEGRITGELCVADTHEPCRFSTPTAALLYAIELLSEVAT